MDCKSSAPSHKCEQVGETSYADGPYAIHDYARTKKIQQGRDFINATHAKIREVLYKILALLFSSIPAGFVEGRTRFELFNIWQEPLTILRDTTGMGIFV